MQQARLRILSKEKPDTLVIVKLYLKRVVEGGSESSKEGLGAKKVS